MAVIDWDDSGDIAIQDIATGKLRRLLAKPPWLTTRGTPTESGPLFLRISRKCSFSGIPSRTTSSINCA